jgi:hypothetical protein
VELSKLPLSIMVELSKLPLSITVKLPPSIMVELSKFPLLIMVELPSSIMVELSKLPSAIIVEFAEVIESSDIVELLLLELTDPVLVVTGEPAKVEVAPVEKVEETSSTPVESASPFMKVELVLIALVVEPRTVEK